MSKPIPEAAQLGPRKFRIPFNDLGVEFDASHGRFGYDEKEVAHSFNFELAEVIEASVGKDAAHALPVVEDVAHPLKRAFC